VAIPKVVIVGRPNVGKSSLFNWLVGQRIAIVDPTAGVTRDRVNFILEHEGQYLELVDTGGMGIEDGDGLTKDVERQIAIALAEADAILFVVDAQTGLLPLDQLVAEKLRHMDKPVLAVANKCDNAKMRANAEAEFYSLGRELVFVSTVHNVGREAFWPELLKITPKETTGADDVTMKIAVVGKRNAGKSTFINFLAESERMIVSEVPGTTRDSVDVRFQHNDRTFVAIDTAGVRRTRSLANGIEFYSFSRAQRTIRRADVVLLFIDSQVPLSKVDQQLAHFIAEHHKPCILVVNKWDLASGVTTSEFNDYLEKSIGGLDFAPRAFITAKTGKNVGKLVDLAWSLFKQASVRVPTPELNRVLRDAVERRNPPLRQNRTPKLYYATQAAVSPPTLVLFCNGPKLLDPTYQRYLLNAFRENLPFSEVPIRLCFRKRGEGIGAEIAGGEDPTESEASGEAQAPVEE
jgi:GTP-binding protein